MLMIKLASFFMCSWKIVWFPLFFSNILILIAVFLLYTILFAVNKSYLYGFIRWNWIISDATSQENSCFSSEKYSAGLQQHRSFCTQSHGFYSLNKSNRVNSDLMCAWKQQDSTETAMNVNCRMQNFIFSNLYQEDKGTAGILTQDLLLIDNWHPLKR